MNSKFYKCCAVPHCKNTTIKTNAKLFIHVPRTEDGRKKWLQLASRDPALVSTQSKMYFCEDHFDLANDMENYTEYRVTGSTSQIRMKASCLPSKFACQPDQKGPTDITTQSVPAKPQKLETIKEFVREIEESHSTESVSTVKVQPGQTAAKINSKFYKYCAVPQCRNTTIKTPKKLFVYVPHSEDVRRKWFKLARRDPSLVSTQSVMYFCEDHFDLPHDMENYTKYRLMGSISQIRMKAGCLPSKFACQPDRKRRTDIKTTRSLPAKKQRLEAIAECEREIKQAQSTQSIATDEAQTSPKSAKINSKPYKSCAVPQCRNTTIKTPKKLFIYVPHTEDVRKKWLKLAHRDPSLASTQSRLYFCEDHFDLPNDMENYTKYRLMGSVAKIRMRAGCMPTKFPCQSVRKRKTDIKNTRSLTAKRQKLKAIAESKNEIEEAGSTQSISTAEVEPTSGVGGMALDVCVKLEPAWPSGEESEGEESTGEESEGEEPGGEQAPSELEESAALKPRDLVFTNHMCIEVEAEFVKQEVKEEPEWGGEPAGRGETAGRGEVTERDETVSLRPGGGQDAEERGTARGTRRQAFQR